MRMNLKLWHVIVLVLVLSGPSVWAANTMWSALTALTGANVASGDKIPLLDVSDTTHGAGGTAKTITANELKYNYIYAAGSATAGSWPVIPAGTVLTTAEAGAIERDANAWYLTTDAGNRGVVPVEHWVRADSSRSLPNDTNENPIFDSANDTLTLETGLYEFSFQIGVTGMSATSGNALIDIVGAGTVTAGTWLWMICGLDTSTLSTIADDDCAQRTTQDSAASAVAAAVNTGMRAYGHGTFEVTVAGTIIPSIDLVTASATTLSAGSFFRIKRIGSTSMVAVGQWN